MRRVGAIAPATTRALARARARGGARRRPGDRRARARRGATSDARARDDDDSPPRRLRAGGGDEAFRERVARGRLWLAPLTKGGNAPFRRLCASDFGAEVVVSEMAFARFLCKGARVERARVRRHEGDAGDCFGAQIATNAIEEGVNAAKIASGEFGADFVDLNCGCPIHETWKRGLGAALLKKPAKLERLVEGIARGIDVPLTVKIRLGIESSSQARRIAEGLENAGRAPSSCTVGRRSSGTPRRRITT